MNWDDLRFLLAVHRERTLSAAAKVLGVNHTTVSRRVQALEEDVGVRLFDRLPEGYVATAAGEDIVSVAEGVEQQIQGLDRRVLGLDARLSGSLRLTTIDLLARHHIDALDSFVQRYPGVDLHISADNEVRSLTKREADIAFRLTNKPPEHLVGRKLARAEFAVYAAKPVVERVGPDAGLADYPWMAWDERSGARLTERWMQTHVPDARIVCRVDSTPLMVQSIQYGLGIGFLPCYDGDHDPRLVRLRDREEGFGMDLWLLTHPDLRNTARIRAFTDHMADAVRPFADRYAGVIR